MAFVSLKKQLSLATGEQEIKSGFFDVTVDETEGLCALAGENSHESLWKEELNSLNRSHTFLQVHVDVLVTMSDRLCRVGTWAMA